jgi:tetratricopeptide (TPR) repeat protein
MSSAGDILSEAGQALQAGNPRHAEWLCAHLLADEPEHAAGWELSGKACRALGNLTAAAASFAQWLRVEPRSADAHFLLGSVLADQGKRDEALDHYRQTLALKPDHAEALNNLGIALADQGRLEEALSHLRAACRLYPDFAQAHFNLGQALAQHGEPDQAFAELELASRLRPDYGPPHWALGNLHNARGRRDEAMASYRRALERQPDHPAAYTNLGMTLIEAGRPWEAVVLLRQAARLRPQAPEAHNNVGIALTELGRFAEAEASYLEALRLAPAYVDAQVNLASCYKEQDRLEEALAGYQIALWLKPDGPSAHWNRSLAFLKAGDFERGWPEYEWRWQRPKTPARRLPQPAWDGADPAGKTILVYMEQGLGDHIQFIRHAKLLHEAGARVVVECPGFLVPLFSTCSGIDQLVAEGGPLPEFDCHVALMSLPYRLGTKVETIPEEVPYLFADVERVQRWREELAASLAGRTDLQSVPAGGDGLKIRPTGADGMPIHPTSAAAESRIGVAWQGNPHHPWDRHRSFPLTCLEALARVPGVRLVSLQKRHGTEQLGQLKGRFPITELPSEQDADQAAFMDTAAIMQNLDLVVTADTAIAHLAGALGVPVWVALSTITDWRWLVGPDDSPWYPTMRLWRQRALGDWDGVFHRMAATLKQAVKGRKKADDAKGRAGRNGLKPTLTQKTGTRPEGVIGGRQQGRSGSSR